MAPKWTRGETSGMCQPASGTPAARTPPFSISIPASHRLGEDRRRLSRLQGKCVIQRLHLGLGRDVEKATGEPEVFQERPEILVPGVAIERKAPEIVEQYGGGDHIEYEQQRGLAAIKTKQDANWADDLEDAAEHQQQRCHRRRQRYPAMSRLVHRRLVVEDLVERAERENQD